jgi:hypothetical protein
VRRVRSSDSVTEAKLAVALSRRQPLATRAS